MILAERIKIFYDHCKHMTILAAGANVFMVTVFEKLSKSPRWLELIGYSVTAFCISLVSSLVAMFLFAVFQADKGVHHPDFNAPVSWFSSALLFFSAGFVWLLEFMWRHLKPNIFGDFMVGTSIFIVIFLWAGVYVWLKRRRPQCFNNQDWRVHVVDNWLDTSGRGQHGVCTVCKGAVVRDEAR